MKKTYRILCFGSFAIGITIASHAATYTVSNTAASGDGSLAQAILEANATVGVTDTIVFNLPGAGVQTITAINLPPITDPVVLDGSTQPGYAGTPLVLLDGKSARSTASGGLMIRAGNSVVRALAIANVGQCCSGGQGPGLLLQDGGS